MVVAPLLVGECVRGLDFEDEDVQVRGDLVADGDAVTHQVEEGQAQSDPED